MRRLGCTATMLRSLACLAACMLLLPAGTSIAQPHRHASRSAEQPTSYELLHAMTTAADEWWTGLGSPPPCAGRADVQLSESVDGVHQAFGYYGSCVIVLAPHWWTVQYSYLTSRARRWQRIRAAAFDLALIMHERGHNLGYGHIAGTVMDPDAPVVPGWAVEWAIRMIR